MLCLQMVFSEYIKLCILYHHNNGLKPYTIVKPKPKYASYNVHVLLTLVYALIMYIQHVHVVLTEYYDTHFIYFDQNIL